MKRIGIDIGTTTICGAVLDNNQFIESITEQNTSFIITENEWEKQQNPEIIIPIAMDIINELLLRHPDAASIGVSGQMHGILYTDIDGNAVSNLFTWQDKRGDELYEANETYAEYVSKASQKKAACGYGLVTHFYNCVNGLVPSNAEKLCTIHDYLVMKLCNLKLPLVHTSNAASFGCFDLKSLAFDFASIEKLNISKSILPDITNKFEYAGRYKNIPVVCAIGDNQASFIGSLADENSILINIGTGSQISVMVNSYVETYGNIELRPLKDDKYLLVGSSLNGGRAYAILEKFMRSVACMAGVDVDSMYPYMAKALEKYSKKPTLVVSTLFDGTRDDPDKRGYIENIGIDNFTPEQLMLGFAEGIARELYDMFVKMRIENKTKLIGSGNGIRLNKAVAGMVEKLFGLNVSYSEFNEEAACGAAISGDI